jgi:hypothetical protein
MRDGSGLATVGHMTDNPALVHDREGFAVCRDSKAFVIMNSALTRVGAVAGR